MSLGRSVQTRASFAGGLICLTLFGMLCGLSLAAAAQSWLPQTVNVGTGSVAARGITPSSNDRPPDRHSGGYISGTVLDKAGAVAIGAHLRLIRQDQPQPQEVRSGDNGQFVFVDQPPGSFQLTITADGFEPQSLSGTLRPGEAYIVPVIRLAVATVVTEVRVGGSELTTVELAESQIHEQEKQRVSVSSPIFLSATSPTRRPSCRGRNSSWLGSHRSIPSPSSVSRPWPEFSRRRMTSPATGKACRVMRNASAPLTLTFYLARSLEVQSCHLVLKQDPRYFYKGTGSGRSRFLYYASPIRSFVRVTTSAGSRITRAFSEASQPVAFPISTIRQAIAMPWHWSCKTR